MNVRRDHIEQMREEAEIYNTNLMVEIQSYINDSMKDMAKRAEYVMMLGLFSGDIDLKDVFQMLDNARSTLSLPQERYEW